MQLPTYMRGDSVEIVGGEYAGLGGTVVNVYDGGYEVSIGGYLLPVATNDLAPELLTSVTALLVYLEQRYHDDPELVRRTARLRAALNAIKQGSQ